MRRGKYITLILLLCIMTLCLAGCGQMLQDLEQEMFTPISEDKEKDIEEYSVSFEAEEPGTFAYDRLSETEQIWYRDINRLLAYRMDEYVELSVDAMKDGLTAEDIDKIYNCVMMDHPEYFYVDGYEYVTYLNGVGKLVEIEICGKYTCSLEECEERQKEIEEAAEDLLWYAPTDEDDYEKIRYVYETIIQQTDYDMNVPDNQNIYSVLVGKASVCQGYAKATQYLLNELGVDCSIVFGKVRDGESHSWNIVKCNGAYYHMDTTWGDASYSMNGEMLTEAEAPEINYDYLCIPTEQLEKTHEIKDIVELPDCDSLEDNYYVREGKYFYSYDEEQLQRELTEAFEEGERSVTIKCDSGEVYDTFYKELIENQLIFSYLPEEYESISYIEDEEQLSLSFWVTK